MEDVQRLLKALLRGLFELIIAASIYGILLWLAINPVLRWLGLSVMSFGQSIFLLLSIAVIVLFIKYIWS